jgi:phenol hydroxylase P2 protein
MTTVETKRERFVAVDIQKNEEGWNVLQAILKDNTGAKIDDFPGYYKVKHPEKLLIRRETVEKIMGRPWDTQEFNLVIISYAGNFAEWDDEKILIQWDTHM